MTNSNTFVSVIRFSVFFTVCFSLYMSVGVNLLLYIIFVSFLMLWSTCMFINLLMKQDRPIDYESLKVKEWKFNDKWTSNNISIMLNDKIHQVADKIYSYLYNSNTSKISDDINETNAKIVQLASFLTIKLSNQYSSIFQSNLHLKNEIQKALITVLTRLNYIVLNIDIDKITVKIMATLLYHLKEHKKALNDQTNRHASYKTNEALQKYVHSMFQVVLKELVPYELWNSIPCCALVAMISRKLSDYIINDASDPKVIYSTIATVLQQLNDKNEMPKAAEIQEVSVETLDKISENETDQESQAIEEQSQLNDEVVFYIGNQNSENEQEKKISEKDALMLDISESLDWSHFSVNKSDTDVPKTSSEQTDKISNVIDPSPWPTEFDFISSVDNVVERKRLWNSSDGEIEPTTIIPQEKKPNVEPFSSTMSSAYIKTVLPSSMQFKGLKDLESTFTDSMHKIEDETLSYVEGILDFGRAGFHKGLQLTGLHENFTSSKSSPKDIEVFDGDNYHLKGQDSPEYEEPADLASTLNKIRSLLQQKTNDTIVEKVGTVSFSNNEKTALSPVIAADSFNFDITPTFGNKSTGDNFLARTVTGMFNTLKTALPTVSDAVVPITIRPFNQRWVFQEAHSHENDIYKLLDIYLKNRNNFYKIDVASEAVDFLDALTLEDNSVSDMVTYGNNSNDCFSKIPITRLVVDVCCELLQDTKSSVVQDSFIRSFLLLFGNAVETKISSLTKELILKLYDIEKFISNMQAVGKTDENISDVTVLIKKLIPNLVKEIIGKEDIHLAIAFLLESFQDQNVNQDLCIQLLEIVMSSVSQTNKSI